MVHYVLYSTFEEEVCVVAAPQQWAHLVENHLVNPRLIVDFELFQV